MNAHIPTLEQLKRAAQVAEQIAKLEAELQAVLGGAKTRGRKPGKAAKTEEGADASEAAKPAKKSRKKRARNMTPEARARIAEAQKARWAKFRKDQKA